MVLIPADKDLTVDMSYEKARLLVKCRGRSVGKSSADYKYIYKQQVSYISMQFTNVEGIDSIWSGDVGLSVMSKRRFHCFIPRTHLYCIIL